MSRKVFAPPTTTSINDVVAKSMDPFERTIQRTAVVWTTLGITTECEAARLRHLVETADGMDVWVSHAHHVLEEQGKLADVEKSQQYMASIPGLHQWQQNRIAKLPFDGMSGSSKSSFLNFLVEHSSQYDFAWHIENDAFLTGPWGSSILQPEMKRDTTTDFLSSITINRKDQYWYWIDHPKKNCTILSKPCKDIQRIQIGWMFSRISTRLAQSLYQDVVEGQIRGHHEAIVGPYTVLKNFTYDKVDKTKIGAGLNFGHAQGTDERKMDVKSFRLPSKEGKPRLLHPVKCAAYYDGVAANNPHQKNIHPPTKTMQRDIEKWTVKKSPPKSST